jgi:hypothetical protein
MKRWMTLYTALAVCALIQSGIAANASPSSDKEPDQAAPATSAQETTPSANNAGNLPGSADQAPNAPSDPDEETPIVTRETPADASAAPILTPGDAPGVEGAPGIPAPLIVQPNPGLARPFVYLRPPAAANAPSFEEIDRRIAELEKQLQDLRKEAQDRKRRGRPVPEILDKRLSESSRSLWRWQNERMARSPDDPKIRMTPPPPSADGLPRSFSFDDGRLNVLTGPPGKGNVDFRYFTPAGRPDLGDLGRRAVTFRSEKGDAAQVVQDLLKKAGASYVIAGDIAKGRPITCNFNNTPLQDALGAIMDAAGLDYRVRDNILILTPRMAFPQAFAQPNSFQFAPGTTPWKSDSLRLYQPNAPVPPGGPRTRALPTPANPFQPGEGKRNESPGMKGRPVAPEDFVPKPRSGLSPGDPAADSGISYGPDDGEFTHLALRMSPPMTMEKLFHRLDLPAQLKAYDPGLLSWDVSEDPKGRMPDGLLRLEGRASGGELLAEGTPDALRAFLEKVRFAYSASDAFSPQTETKSGF